MHTTDSIPVTLDGTGTDQLPRFSGVYRFFGQDDQLLYVGKSVDIRARIRQHFLEGQKPGRHQRIMQQVDRIDCRATAGEVGALLLENAAIKAETPLYNRRQRQVRKLWSIALHQGNDGFLKPEPVDFLPDAERSMDSYGLFHNKRHVDSSIQRHARDHGLCLRVLGIDRGKGPCFQHQLKRCDGACAGMESADSHNARLLSVLDRDRIAAWPFPGPLALRETNIAPQEGQPSEEFHAVHHWCYLGTFSSLASLQEAVMDVSQERRSFDRDAYRLLLNALRRGRVSLLDAVSGKEQDNPLLGTGKRRTQ